MTATNDFLPPRQSVALSWLTRRKSAAPLADAAILAIWVGLVVLQAWHHVPWRDEVRALSIALSGDDFGAMLRNLKGEGHPALWYLLLRSAHVLFPSPLVLPILSGVIGFGAVALFVLRSPFPRWCVALIVFGQIFLYTYAVEARNYGLSALFLFAIADLYARRGRAWLLGGLLFALANTNIIGAITVGGFLVFWLGDLLAETGLRSSRRLRDFGIAAVFAGLGILIAAATILPTTNDAAAIDWSNGSPLLAALIALIDPGLAMPGKLFGKLLPSPIGSLLLFGLVAGLARRPAALAGAAASLMVLVLFSALAAPGEYRHAAVWFCFILALYWITWHDAAIAGAGPFRRILDDVGRAALVAVVAVQLAAGAVHLGLTLGAGLVEGRSADLARLIADHPDLKQAVILSDPDYLVEPLPYYLPNRLYLAREHRYGAVVRFSRSGQLLLTLGELLAEARAIREETSAPVLILLSQRLNSIEPDAVVKEGYNWKFRASAVDIHDFLSSTDQIASYGPSETDETYDVYRLKP